MAKGNKEKLKAMKLMDGKAAPDATPTRNPLDNFKSIDELLGVKPSNPFKANTAKEFESQLAEMNLADMQCLAPRVGLIPIHDKPLLKKRLMDEFRKDYRKRIGYNEAEIMSTADKPLSEDASARAMKILKEGR
jgi:hypothetical protein